MKLISEGRRTGLPHVTEIRFVFFDGSFFVLAGRDKSDWVKNSLKAGRAKVRTDYLIFKVAARTATVVERASTIRAFTSKYGARVVRDWYFNPKICLRFTAESPPTQRGAVGGEGEATTTYSEWVSQDKDYCLGVAEAFDSASEEYDFTISHNYINTWIRKRSIRELLRFTNPKDTLLEVGCGTGAETIEISPNVSKIIATDISKRMIEILTKKIVARGLSGRIAPMQVRAANIAQVADQLGHGKIDVAYSFNGALNCEPELQRFVDGLSSILAPGGYFICSIRNCFCLGEALSHAAVLQFEKMTPRKKQPVMVSVGGIDIPAIYYSPKTFSKFFSRKFRLRKLYGLPAFLPPAYLSNYCVKFRKATFILERFESLLAGNFPFNRFGDQSLFVFQKSQRHDQA
jgi:ubiquinone/menaquinone biosynthesis C-methylase UbiE